MICVHFDLSTLVSISSALCDKKDVGEIFLDNSYFLPFVKYMFAFTLSINILFWNHIKCVTLISILSNSEESGRREVRQITCFSTLVLHLCCTKITTHYLYIFKCIIYFIFVILSQAHKLLISLFCRERNQSGNK